MHHSMSVRFARRHHFIALGLLMALIFGTLIPAAHAQTNGTIIESDDSQVRQLGTWARQTTATASGGSYLYSSGAEQDVLTLQFSGPAIEVIYVAGPSLGTLAIDVDGTVLRTVITTADQTAYAQSARVDYLTNEAHEVKVYAQEGGIVGVDAFVIPTPSPSPLSGEGNSSGETRATTCAPINAIYRASVNHLGEQGTAISQKASISSDGRYVAFESAARLVPADSNAFTDAYVYDRQTCTVQMVSVSNSGGIGNGGSFDVVISGNGRLVAFASIATNLVAGDTNSQSDVFVYDRQLGTTTRVSVDSGFGQATGGPSLETAISANGRFIAFQSAATNLVPGDTNGELDVFVRDMQSALTFRVSISDTEAQSTGGFSASASLSADGRYIAFHSVAANLVTGDTNAAPDVFVRDMQANTTTRVSVSSAGAQGNGGSDGASLSADGRYVAFHSSATNLVAGDTNGLLDVFVRDTQTNTTTRISVSSAGAQAVGNDSSDASISADGRYIVFESLATNLVAGDTNNLSDVFVRDTQTNTTTRISVSSTGTQATGGFSGRATISADGRYIVFESNATNLVAGDTNAVRDVFVSPRVQPAADTLALFNPPFQQINLINTLADSPLPSAYTAFSAYAPASGGAWVMGDWNADGLDTPGVYRDGAFYFTNKSGESQPSDWRGFWIGIFGPVVAGRFSNASANDCVGAVDSVPFSGLTIFALYFTCDMSGATLTPPLTFQWLSTPLPDPTFTGTFQFSAGDFNGDGLDSVAVRRGEFIAYGNVNPAAGPAIFDLAQYIGTPGTGDIGSFVIGDWDGNGLDSFGLFYQNGELFYRNDLDFNSGVYVNQSVGTPFGNTGVQVATWR